MKTTQNKVHAYFLSDLHLTNPDAGLYQSCLKFLSSLGTQREVTHLFLLGDIFDLWVGKYSYFIEKHKSFIKEIQRLVHLGVEVHYFEGNHDLYLKLFWEPLGVNVHESAVKISLNGTSFYLEHGDLMDPEDRGYLLLRRFLRAPLVKFILTHLPAFFVVRIGEKMSQKSRAYTQSKFSKDQIRKKVLSHVRKNIRENVHISGHVHVLMDEELNVDGQFIRVFNLGSWSDAPKVLYFSETFSWMRL